MEKKAHSCGWIGSNVGEVALGHVGSPKPGFENWTHMKSCEGKCWLSLQAIFWNKFQREKWKFALQ